MTERQTLETMESLADWYYKKTGDKWYKKLSDQISKKLNGSPKMSIYLKRKDRK